MSKYDILDDIYKQMYDVFVEIIGEPTEIIINEKNVILGRENPDPNVSGLMCSLTEFRQKFGANFDEWRDYLKAVNTEATDIAENSLLMLPVSKDWIDTVKHIEPIVGKYEDYGIYYVFALSNPDSKTQKLLTKPMLPHVANNPDELQELLDRRYEQETFYVVENGKINKYPYSDGVDFLDVVLKMMVTFGDIEPEEALHISLAYDADDFSTFGRIPERGCRIIGRNILEALLNPDTRKSVYDELLSKYFTQGEKVYCLPIKPSVILLIPQGTTEGIKPKKLGQLHVTYVEEMYGDVIKAENNLDFRLFPIMLEGTGKREIEFVQE